MSSSAETSTPATELTARSPETPTSTTETTVPSTETTTETTKPTQIITLKTSDGEIIEVEEAVAMEFAIVKSFFEESPSSNDTVPLPNVPAKPVKQVIEFCKEVIKFKKNPDKEKQKEFNEVFLKEKSNEELLEMIPAANYLEIEDFLDVLCQAIADRIQNKSVEYVREIFGIENDISPEEEARLREEYYWAFEDIDED